MVARRLSVAAALLCATAVHAQSIGTWEIAVHGMSTTSPSIKDGFFGGQAAGVSQVALGLRASTDLVRLGRVRVRYSAQLIPLMRVSHVERYERLTSSAVTTYVLTGTTNAYGAGFTPLGLDLGIDLGHHLRIQGGAAAGVSRFTQHIPLAAGRQRNFSAEWDAMAMYDIGHGRSVQLGLRWKHLSNGYTAYENPGIDNRLLFGGMSWRVRAPR